MAPQGSLVPFIQFDLPAAGGLPDGRYMVRGGGEARDTVLVSELVGALPARGRLRGRKPVEEQPEAGSPAIAIRRVTYALAERLEGKEEAKLWLAGASTGEQAIALVTDGLALVNRAIAAYRVSAALPTISEVAAEDSLAIRIGYGTGDEIAASGWTDAVRLPALRREKRKPGTEDIRPPQRLAAILAGRDGVDPWELHALRAQLDFEHGRPAEAEAELRAAIAAFDAAPPDFAPNLREEIAGRLADARATFGAQSARLAGPAPAAESEALADAVDLFTRLQNRRRRPPVD